MKNRRRSVLIAENDRAIAHGLRTHLEMAGLTVLVAYDGEQAAILAARQRFEMIITNLDLPQMTGAEFCRHVREDLRLTEVPIVLCAPTGRESDCDRLKYTHAVTQVFYKPIDPQAVTQFAKETVEYLVGTA